MNKIIIVSKTLEDFRETFIKDNNVREILLPLKYVDDPDSIAVGESVEIIAQIQNVQHPLELTGEVKWKRLKDITLPGKKIRAGFGIEVDEVSVELLKLHIQEAFRELSSLDDEMVGGNYIKVRTDIVAKYNIESKKASDFSEKRAYPRITITIPVEIFIQNKTKKFNTTDISFSGMCIATSEKLPVGEEVLVVFEDKIIKKQFLVKAIILRNMPENVDDAPRYSVGLKFIFEDDRQKKELMKFIIKKA
ncbi:MAG: PilZ domain-containing protein [bacterium]